MDDLIENINDTWDNREVADEEFWKEIDAHPAFSTNLDNSDISSATEALQSIKFDNETVEDNAYSYKDEANYFFKKKNYVLAIHNYTKALLLKMADQEFNATLYCNRATCKFHQGNYRMCIKDCIQSIKCNKTYVKPYFRAAKAALSVNKVDEGIEFCTRGLKVSPDSVEIQALLKELQDKKPIYDKVKATDEANDEDSAIKQLLKKRGVQLRSQPSSVEIPMQHLSPPSLDSEGVLSFNVLILYPEYSQTDFLTEVSELATLSDCLRSIFSANQKSVEWDLKGHYVLFTPLFKPALEVYVESDSRDMVFIDQNKKIRDVLVHKNFRLRQDLVLEISVVSVLSTTFYSTWKKQNIPVDLD